MESEGIVFLKVGFVTIYGYKWGDILDKEFPEKKKYERCSNGIKRLSQFYFPFI